MATGKLKKSGGNGEVDSDGSEQEQSGDELFVGHQNGNGNGHLPGGNGNGKIGMKKLAYCTSHPDYTPTSTPTSG